MTEKFNNYQRPKIIDVPKRFDRERISSSKANELIGAYESQKVKITVLPVPDIEVSDHIMAIPGRKVRVDSLELIDFFFWPLS